MLLLSFLITLYPSEYELEYVEAQARKDARIARRAARKQRMLEKEMKKQRRMSKRSLNKMSLPKGGVVGGASGIAGGDLSFSWVISIILIFSILSSPSVTSGQRHRARGDF